MPEDPVYLDLLPPIVKASLGLVHPETKPALAILESEGFQRTDLVDIFDGGPLVQCARDQIQAVQRCRPRHVVEILDRLPEEVPTQIVSSQHGGFSAILTPVDSPADHTAVISAHAADVLGVTVGGVVWAMPMKAPSVIPSVSHG
jgi:arginine N-succinyltransferase